MFRLFEERHNNTFSTLHLHSRSYITAILGNFRDIVHLPTESYDQLFNKFHHRGIFREL